MRREEQQREVEEIEQGEQEQLIDASNTSKLNNSNIRMPMSFGKAKRSINRLVSDFFNHLKDEIQKRNAKIYLNRNKLSDVMSALLHYVNIRHDRPENFSLKIKNQKSNRQLRNGVFSYLKQSSLIMNYGTDGRITNINIDKGSLKLPDLATPVPFQRNIYLLDSAMFNISTNVFIPCAPLKITSDHKLVPLSKNPALLRTKCALAKDKDSIYLLGGLATQMKIITNRCQRFIVQNQTFEEIASLNHKHNCPSVTFHRGQLWIFSQRYIEYLDKSTQKWKNVDLAFGGINYPFQFVTSINQDEILIFGGLKQDRKVTEVKIFRPKDNIIDNYGDLLPEGLSNERSWGPELIHGHVTVICGIQASVYPQIAIKSSVSQVVQIGQQSIYLSSVILK